MINKLVITSFYTNIAVCALIAAAGIMIFCYIINFCRKEKIQSPKLYSIAFFWLFAGFSWLFPGLSVYMHGVHITDHFNRIYDILSFHSVILSGIALTFYVTYKYFHDFKRAVAGAGFMAFCGAVYSFLIFKGDWKTPIYSDWGLAVVPPPSVVNMSLVFGGLFAVVVLADFFANFQKLRKKRTEENIYEFLFASSIALYFFSCMFDVVGTPGWRMVLDRIFILISALAAFLAIYLTDYLEASVRDARIVVIK